MKKEDLRFLDFLGHILQATDRINTYTEDIDEVVFLQSEIVQDAVIRNIEIIGEAARNIERYHPKFAEQYPDIPWADVYLMRNRVSHGYFAVDLEVIWKAVERDIPELEQQVRMALHQEQTNILTKASTQAQNEYPNDIRRQNAARDEIAVSMGLTKEEIFELTSAKSLNSGIGE